MENKMENIGKSGCTEIRQLINHTLVDELAKHGLEHEIKSSRYSDEYVTYKLEVKLAGGKSKAEAHLEVELAERKKYQWMKELDPDKVVEINGGKASVKLHSYNRSARKNKFIVQDVNTGSQYLVSEKEAERFFGVGNL